MVELPVAEFGAKSDGKTDDSAAVLAACTAARDAGVPVLFPPNSTTRIATPIDATGHTFTIRGYGPNSSKIVGDNGCFIFRDRQYGTTIEGLTFRAASGPILKWHIGASYQTISGCVFVAPATAPAIDIVGDYGWIESTVETSSFYHRADATVPTVWIRAANHNLNTITRCRFTDSGDYAIKLDNPSTQTFDFDNVFDHLNFEICSGGAMQIIAAQNTTIRNCAAYDTVAGATRPYFHVKGNGTLRSTTTVFDQVVRRGVASSYADIKLEPGNGTGSVRHCHAASGGASALKVDLGANPTLVDVGVGYVTLTGAENARIRSALT